jgi:AraC-like DNA-binding protein
MGSRPARPFDRRAQVRSALRAREDLWVAPLLAFQPLAREYGIDPVDLLVRNGVDPDAFSDPANRLPFDVVGRLAEACARETGREHFGLMVGHRSGIAAAGIAGELAQHSETVQRGLMALIAHLHLHDRGGVLVLQEADSGYCSLAYLVHHRETPGAVQITDAATAILMAIMRRLCGTDWTPTEVTLARARPRDVKPYRRVFRRPIRFDAARSALIFPERDLERPIANANPAERTRLARLVEQLEAMDPATVTERVVAVLCEMLVAVPPTTSRVARTLALSERTLRRQLAAEGTNFRRLLDEVRLELARQLLEETRMPVGEISATLQYSSPDAFTRAFRRWAGETPLHRRKATIHTGGGYAMR